MTRQGNKGKSSSGSKTVKLGPVFPPELLNRLLRSQGRCIPFRNTFLTMYNTSQCSRGIPNKSDSEQKQDNFYYSSPKAATDMGVSSSESHDLTAFYEMLSASFGVLSQNTGFYPSLDRIIETTLGPLNLGPGGRSYNKPISRLQWPDREKKKRLCTHITKYMGAAEEKNLYQPFCDFANELFTYANLLFGFLNCHAQSCPNDDPT